MNILQGAAAEELRRLLLQYIEDNGPSLGKSFFSSHVREIERALLEEADREIKAGRLGKGTPRPKTQA